MKITFMWEAKRTFWKMYILKDMWTLKDFFMGNFFFQEKITLVYLPCEFLFLFLQLQLAGMETAQCI